MKSALDEGGGGVRDKLLFMLCVCVSCVSDTPAHKQRAAAKERIKYGSVDLHVSVVGEV